MMSGLIDHLWQSTVVACVAATLVVLCRHNRPAVRYAIWWAASVKFLVPFAALVALGNVIEHEPVARQVAGQIPVAVSTMVVHLGTPFSTADTSTAAPTYALRDWTMVMLAAIWAGGCLAILLKRWQGWRRIRAAVRASAPLTHASLQAPDGVDLRVSPHVVEPGVAGFRRQVILMPAGIEHTLSPAQLRAILAHEMCHVGRRDNLTAAVHMLVEALFWFHPLVWWIGARLVQERERACDEHVLSLTGDSRTYADGIVSVCRQYTESPIACVSGVNGGDIKSRIEAIMRNRTSLALNPARWLALACVCAATITFPIVVGALDASTQNAQATASVAPVARFEAVSIRPTDPDFGPGMRMVQLGGGVMNIEGYTVESLLRLAFDARWYQVVSVPKWATTARYNIIARASTPVSGKELWRMLVPTLEDRFRLQAHREKREMDVYKLTVERPGKLQEATADCFDPNGPLPKAVRTPHGQRPLLGCGQTFPLLGPRAGTLWGAKVTSATLALALTDLLKRHVVDDTGITNAFDLELKFALDSIPGMPPISDADPFASDILTAVREQLGLRLVSGRAPVDVVVIDRIEPASEN